MEKSEVEKVLATRMRAIMKAARDLQIAFNAEKEAVDRLHKEFTKLRKMQGEGQIGREFSANTQASNAWLYKVGTEEMIRLGLPWAKGRAAINPAQLVPLKDAFEANFSNMVATTPAASNVENIEKQAEWEAEQARLKAELWADQCIRAGLQAGMGDGFHPESDEIQDYVVNFWGPKHHPAVKFTKAAVRETLKKLGYFDPNVTDRGRRHVG